jgi:hypothetical protein
MRAKNEKSIVTKKPTEADLKPLEELISRPSFVDEVDTELAERDLFQFIQQAWHVVEPGEVFVPGWHLEAIAEHLAAVSNGQIRDLLITVPPRHMKSLSVAVFWPAWEWLKKPETRWLFASYSDPLSVRDSRVCRLLIQSPWYRRR